MKLYFLKPIKDWKPWWDRLFSIIVRAETEEEARQIASIHSGREGEEVWFDSSLTSCEILTEEGEKGVVLKDYFSS